MNKANRVLGVLFFSLLISSAGFAINAPSIQAHGDDDGHDVVGQVEAAHTTVVDHSLRNDIARQNSDLTSQLSTYTNSKNKSADLTKLIATAKARKAKMLEVARTNPADFLSSVIPAATYNKLPKEVQDQTEKSLQVQGKLRVIHLDGTNGKDLPNRYEVTDSKTNKTYSVYFGQGEVPLSKNGSVVKANGLYLDSSLVVPNGSSQSSSSGLTYLQSSQTLPSSLGPQNILAILVNLTDSSPQKPYTQADIQSALFTGPQSANSYYKEVSYNQVSLTGDVTPWLNIPFSGADCTTASGGDGISAALSAATAAGYNLNNYSRYMFYMPLPTCTFAAGAASGNTIGIFTNENINGNIYPHTTIHEIGHSLNIGVLGHASTIDCGTKQIDVLSSCMIDEYGDPTDVMGNGNFGLNGPHRAQLSWIPSSRIQTVVADGTYTVSPLESPTGMQLLKIAKPDSNASYYVEYRQPIGLDSAIPSAFTAGAGIIVDPINEHNVGRINPTPTDNVYGNLALADNLSFVDSLNGITIKQTNHSSAGVTLQVTFASSTCEAVPSVTASPSTQSGSLGVYLTYNVNVTNNDQSGCNGSNFGIDLDSTGTSLGLKLEAAKQTGVLAPGASNITVVRVAPTSASQTGNLNFAFVAKDVSSSTHTANSQQVTYNVAGGCNRSLPTVTSSNQTQSGDRGVTLNYDLLVKNNDSGNCPSSSFKVYGSTIFTPLGWTFSNPVTLLLAPGTTGSARVSVTSPMDAVLTNNIPVNIEDSNVNNHSTTINLTYVVTGVGCTKSPPTMTLVNSNLSGFSGDTLSYALKLSNNNSNGCPPLVVKYEVVGLPTGFTWPSSYVTFTTPASNINLPLAITSPSSAIKQTNNFTIYLSDNVTGERYASVPATFTVLGNPLCSAHQTSSTVAPTSQSGSKGQTLQYNVTINNNDAADCADTLFSVGASSLPSGFTSDSPTVKIAPGKSGSATLSVTSPLTANSGNNTFNVNVTAGTNPLHSSTLAAAYNVGGIATCVRAKPTITVSPTSQLGNPSENVVYDLYITNNDLYSCPSTTFTMAVAPSNFIQVGFVWTPSITLAPGAIGTSHFVIIANPGTTGSNVFSVTSSDSSEPLHSASATATFLTKTAADCTRYAPTFSISPKSLTGVAGSTFSYMTTVTNNDTAACSSSSFGVGAIDLTSNFASYGDQKVMAPGTTATLALNITSVSGTPNGTYTVNAKVADYTNLNHVTYDLGTLVVSSVPVNCTRSTPTVTLSPTSNTGAAASTQNYTVTVTNRDSSGCANATFGISASGLPSGFTSTTPTITSLAPGASNSVTLSVTSPSNASNGTNSFTVSASDTSVSNHTASTTGTYIVNNPVLCNRAAPTITLSPTSNTGAAGSTQSYTATLRNNDSSSCASATFFLSTTGLASSFSTFSSPSSLSLPAGATGSSTINITSPSSAANGTNSFTVTGNDSSVSGHTASTSGSFVVNTPVVCNRAVPDVVLSPTSNTGAAGSTQNYTATVYNNDSNTCPSSTFNISSSLPAGFTSSASSSSFSLPGGNFKAITISITSPSSATNGANSFTVTASDNSVSNHSDSVSGTYVVNTPVICNRAAPLITLSPTSQTGAAGSGQSYSATIYNNDSINCSSTTFNLYASSLPSGFTGTATVTTFTLAGGNFKTATVNIVSPTYASNGSNSFTYTVLDNSISNHNASVTGSYVVNTPVVCKRAVPDVTLSPASNTGAAGSTQNYTATVYNNDSNTCPSSTFNISSSVPSGFTSSVSSSSFSLAGGNFKTITLTVTSSSNAFNGSNSFTVTATDNSLSNHNASVTGSYVVNTPVVCNRKAPLVTLSPSSQTGTAGSLQTYTATIYNNDDNSCPSTTFNLYASSVPSGFISTSNATSFILPGGNFKTVSINITSPSNASGSNSFTYTAYDNSISNHTASASGTYVVNTPVVCKRAVPDVTLSPASNTGAAGSTQSYTARIYNNDDNSCPNTTFNISTSVPAGFTSSASSSSFSLPGGNFKTITLTVTSPYYAFNGSNSFTVSASDTSVSNHTASVTGSYVVNTPVVCNRAAPTMTLSPSYTSAAIGSTSPFTVTVYNNDDNSCPSSTFNISADFPVDFINATASLSPFSLAGGNFKTVTVNVTSSPSALTNFYSFTISASDNVNPNHSVSSPASIYLYSSTSMGARVRGDSTTIPSYADQSSQHVPGILIKMDGTYYITTSDGLIGIPSLEVLNSWGYSLSQAVEGNTADRQLYQIKVLATKQPGQSNPWD